MYKICGYFYTLGLLAWNIIVLEKIIVAELLKKFTALYSILMFVVTFTRACHLSHISPVQILTLFFNTNFSLQSYYILCCIQKVSSSILGSTQPVLTEVSCFL
jgi:hypothetical protein